jgi:hypothetical protein
MSSTTSYFEKYLRSARKKYGSDIASIIVIGARSVGLPVATTSVVVFRLQSPRRSGVFCVQ